MPVYEYQCAECQVGFERRVSMADADVVQCPNGHTRVRRLLSVFATSGRASGAGAAPVAAPQGGCGGHCACH